MPNTKQICETCLHRTVCGKYKATGGVNKCEDYAEERHGRWEDVALRFTQVKEKCTACGGIVYAHGFNYCPNCGAKMDGGEADG